MELSQEVEVIHFLNGIELVSSSVPTVELGFSTPPTPLVVGPASPAPEVKCALPIGFLSLPVLNPLVRVENSFRGPPHFH